MSRVKKSAVAALLALATSSPLHAQTTPSPVPAQSPPKPEAQPAQPAETLPNGASSIVETYEDWTVSCSVADRRKLCVLSQAQAVKQTGERSFVIELKTPRDGRTEGTILVPLGLKLEAGAILKLDGRDLGQGLRFSTCVPQGCLLPVSLPTAATDAIGSAKSLTVSALDLAAGNPVTFAPSLKGFAAAFARTALLGAPARAGDQAR